MKRIFSAFYIRKCFQCFLVAAATVAVVVIAGDSNEKGLKQMLAEFVMRTIPVIRIDWPLTVQSLLAVCSIETLNNIVNLH